VLNPHFRDLLSAFIGANVEFLVVGGYAMAVHRPPARRKTSVSGSVRQARTRLACFAHWMPSALRGMD
jgi:hypothetical protein